MHGFRCNCGFVLSAEDKLKLPSKGNWECPNCRSVWSYSFEYRDGVVKTEYWHLLQEGKTR